MKHGEAKLAMDSKFWLPSAIVAIPSMSSRELLNLAASKGAGKFFQNPIPMYLPPTPTPTPTQSPESEVWSSM